MDSGTLRPERLSREARRSIDNPHNQLFLSPISIWEVGHLVKRKKVRMDVPFPEWVAMAFQLRPVTAAPIDFEVATEVSRITLPQPDPGDLVLAATASVFDLTLVTADEQLLNCPWLKTLG